MSNFNIEHMFINAARMAMINSAQAIMQARGDSSADMRKAKLIANRQNAEYLKQLEIFNSRTKS